MHWSVFAWSALAIAIVMISTWVVSLFLRNASIVDPIWSLGFVVVGWVSFAAMHQHVDALRTGVLLTFVTIWGVRLSLHLFIRNFGHGEDYRYKAMRKKHGAKFWLVSLGTVYVFQGILMWIVSLPLQFGIGIATKTSWWVLPLILGDASVWCGIFLVSLGAGGWAWLGVIGPVVMTTLLRRVSGVTLLEKSLVKRRPGYEDYVRRTSPFLPRPPRK